MIFYLNASVLVPLFVMEQRSTMLREWVAASEARLSVSTWPRRK